jgi:hypothetical protein
MDWIYRAQVGSSDGPYEHRNEPLGSVKGGEYFVD